LGHVDGLLAALLGKQRSIRSLESRRDADAPHRIRLCVSIAIGKRATRMPPQWFMNVLYKGTSLGKSVFLTAW
jgi:hypothetical protein